MKSTKLHIPIPCHENWDSMSAAEQGKHCDKCVKTVFDVSTWSDEEILENYQKKNGEMCMRIQSDRLEPYPISFYNRWKYLAFTALLTIWLSAKKVAGYAQNTKEVARKLSNNVKTVETLKITGVVLDSLDVKGPIAYATITFYKNNKVLGGAISDSLGRFSLLIKETLSEKDTLELKINHILYDEVRKSVTHLKDSFSAEVYMKANHVCLNEVTVQVGRATHSGDDYFMGVPIQSIGVMVTTTGKRKILDEFDTKTYYGDEIERYNLGR